MDDAFAGYHPALNFFFFIAAIVSGMFFAHPAFLCVSLPAAALYYCLLTGTKGLRFLLSMLLLSALVALMNPFFVQEGETVLFTWLGGRRFTREALLYGFAVGGMFLSVLLWFACYNAVMTSDKFIYLFGRCVPAVSLILSMVLRLVPAFEKKAAAIAGARRCIGQAPGDGGRRQRLRRGADILSALTSWALEGAVVTADSMRSRGYGSGGRSSFALYRADARDRRCAAVLLAALTALVVGAAHGAASAVFYPAVSLRVADGYTAAALAGYAILLFTPSVIHIREDVLWRILRSRI